MQITRVLDSVLSKKGKVKVLRLLVCSSGGVTARGMARKVGITHWACIKNLRELEASGLVKSEQAGRANIYTLNQRNIVIREMIIPLYRKERKLPDMILNHIMRGLKGRSVSVLLFGSVARGEDNTDSDLDLCFITKNQRDSKMLESKLLLASSDFYQQYGKKVAPYILTLNSFRKKYIGNVPVVREIVRDGILIFGKSVSSLITT